MTDEEIRREIEEIYKILDTHNQKQLAIENQTFNEQQILRRGLNLTDDRIPFEPFYNRQIPLDFHYPKVFNSRGERMHFCFIRDRDSPHVPHSGHERFIIFDRYNFGLETHAYTMEEIFRPVGNPKHKFAMLIESRAIKPWVFDEILRRKEWMEKEFDFVFTFDAETLNTLKNARFAAFCAGHWFDKKLGGGGQKIERPPKDIHTRKTKSISIVSSNKIMCELHKFRINLAWKCKNEKLADTFGTFNGGEFTRFDIPLLDYRYSIAIENDIKPYWFTEKITNCFAAQTIPIYLGATEIGRFFNLDGIIQIGEEDFDRIEEILARCTPEEYERRLPAILDNYERAERFKSTIDSLYPMYLWKFFEEG